MGSAEARELDWAEPGRAVLDELVECGLLTPEDAQDVDAQLKLMLWLLRNDRISQRFFNWFVRKLADEKAARAGSFRA